MSAAGLPIDAYTSAHSIVGFIDATSLARVSAPRPFSLLAMASFLVGASN
jgi:hypothetical protein